jgi:hypothetical protein
MGRPSNTSAQAIAVRFDLTGVGALLNVRTVGIRRFKQPSSSFQEDHKRLPSIDHN